MTIKPRRLHPGSTLAILSPSMAGKADHPQAYRAGCSYLKDGLGFRLREFPSVNLDNESLHASPELRADEINRAFEDPDVDGIVVVYGGYESIRILPHLNTDAASKNPKFIMGFSDITTIISYLNTKGLVTFHGPLVIEGLAQTAAFPYLRDYHRRVLFGTSPTMGAFPTWSESFLPEGDVREEPLQRNAGWTVVQGAKGTRGKIWGGCIEVLDWLKGTRFWPSDDFWNERILLVETSEEKPSPQFVGSVMRSLGIQGILSRLNGILVGRPARYAEEERTELYHTIREVVGEEFGCPKTPIVGDIDCGHTYPQMILPFGVEVEIDLQRASLEFVDGFFSDSDGAQ